MNFKKTNALEEAIFDVVQNYCVDQEDIENAKKYFDGITINDMIDEITQES